MIREEEMKVYVVYAFFILIAIGFFAYFKPTYTGLATVEKDLKIDLESNKFPPNQLLQGQIALTYDGDIDLTKKLEAEINQVETETDILSLVMNSSYEDQIKTIYDKSTLKTSETFSFNLSNQSRFIGIELPQYSTLTEQRITIQGSDSNPTDSLKIDILDDGKVDWRYLGNLIFFDDFVTSNTITFSESGQEGIKGSRYEEHYCELMNLPFSKTYIPYIKYKVVNESVNEINLRATILNEDLYKKGSCRLPFETNLDWHNCEIDLEDSIEGKYFVCITIESGDLAKKYIDLSYENNINSSGYICGEDSCDSIEDDYFIKVKPGIHETRLQNTATFSDFNQTITDFLLSCEDQKCLVPVKFTSKTSGKITITLTITYSSNDRERTINSFYTLSSPKSSINGKNTVYLPLQNFKTLKTPNKNGNYTLIVNIPTLNLNARTNFTVLSPPIAIAGENKIAYVNEQITFDASKSFSPDSKIIDYYYWDFGDGNTSTDKYTTYVYSKEGSYKVKLLVRDQDNISSIQTQNSTLYIQIISSSEVLGKLIENMKEDITSSLNSLNSLTTKEKEIAKSIDMENQLNSAKEKLDDFDAQYNNGSLNDSIKIIDTIANIKSLQENLPKKLITKTDISYTYIPSDTDINNAITIIGPEKKETLLTAIKQLQNKVDISSEIRIVRVDYFSGKSEDTAYINKNLNFKEELADISVIELVPEGSAIKMESPNFKPLKETESQIADFSKINQNQEELIVYTLSGNISASDIATIITPRVSSIVVTCGNNFCEEFLGETKETCPKDCETSKPKTSLALIIPIILVVVMGGLVVYYFLFSKKSTRLIQKTKPKQQKETVLSQEDRTALTDYIKKTMAKGFKLEQIKNILVKKGWKEEQIQEVLKDFKK